MQDDSKQNGSNVTPPQPTNMNNRKLIIGIGAVLAVLFLILIGLVGMLLTKDDADSANDSSTSQSAQQDNEDAEGDKTVSGREILMRVPTNDPKLEYVIYKPQQNASNTTIYFAVENICEGCDSATSAYKQIAGFDHRTGSYLVDDNNGKKYSTIKDEDDKVLATTVCNQMVKYGEKVDCFVAFSKVPSGSTVSWVFGGNRIDNIKVE